RSSLGMLRSPASPLLPYTTLFRSAVARRVGTRELGPRLGDGPGESLPLGVQRVGVGVGDALFRGCLRGRGVEVVRPAQDHDVVQDRKSTRLNSSHLVISYAVFCLK